MMKSLGQRPTEQELLEMVKEVRRASFHLARAKLAATDTDDLTTLDFSGRCE